MHLITKCFRFTWIELLVVIAMVPRLFTGSRQFFTVTP
jgi:hypothetical protein